MTDLEDPLPLDLLPESVKQMLEVLQLTSVITLINVYGGSRIKVPKRADADHELALLLGFDELKRFSLTYGGLVITFPRCIKAMNFVRDNAILRDKRIGLTQSQLARKYKLTEVAVCNALRRAEQHEYKQHSHHFKQADLFQAA